ncbi:2-oxoacid ferredoxin oxidoreductase [Pseudomonas sp. 21LCFQ02]|uniref:2-oxoacid ferredoxin oxidoreductase n=1 Tax=Pseudomonas sp. 21LCFQ02 TaxID=2957505 RepID=UPI00209AE1F9|nr:2-oxoacid ferredoxin oxidoreductase [Pseudomonas sp. 21LCFQ02]MCO8166917.1 2-oxoacid ferredoxin oxidoreductase [Pseudomonas sp. 21LCFQ02]
MKYAILVMATVLLAGCAAPSNSARSDGPLKTLASEKTSAEVAQCIQVAWQDVKLFGDSADVFLDRQGDGNFTVFTTQTRYFADVLRQGGGSEVRFYAHKGGDQIQLRAAAIATCL